MHTVAVLALDGVVGFDLVIPCEVFGDATAPPQSIDPADRGDAEPQPLYDVRVCGSDASVAINGAARQVFGIVPRYPLEAALDADTIVVPACSWDTPKQPRVQKLLTDAHAAGARIASICGGAFVLAAAGLLDGLRATTHWRHATDLARRYPAVKVDPTVLYVDNGTILTSAGMAAGLDMCLHMVWRDHGAAVAADTARYVVMPLQRDGGQAQFVGYEHPADELSLQPTLTWLQHNLDQTVTLADIARHAQISIRTLNRRFHEQTGTTPLQWLIRQRLFRAQQLLETSAMSIEDIARWTGFGTSINLRQHFSRVLKTTPQTYRHTFQLAPCGCAPAAANRCSTPSSSSPRPYSNSSSMFIRAKQNTLLD